MSENQGETHQADNIFDLSNLGLEKGLDAFSIFGVYQKRNSIQSGKTVGLEVFGRIQDEKGLIYRSSFIISQLIKYDLLESFKAKLLEITLKECLKYPELHGRFSISLNIDLSCVDKQDFIQWLIETFNVLDDQLEIILDLNYEQICHISQPQREVLGLLCSEGLKIALEVEAYEDDLQHILETMPISEVKLKHSLVSALDKHEDALETIEKIISISAKYSLPVVAVGVETEAEYHLIKNSGISFIQGYYFGEEQDSSDLIAEAIDELSAEKKPFYQQRIICFTKNDNTKTNIEDLLLSKAKTDFFKLHSSLQQQNLNIEPNTIVLFDLQDAEDIDYAKQIISHFDNDIASLVLLPKLDSPEQKLALLDIGTYEIIEKPVLPLELFIKVERCFNFLNAHQKIREELEETTTTAFKSMQNASSYGELVRFVKLLSMANTENALRNIFFNYMESQGLKASIFLDNGISEQAYLADGMICPPVEFNMFKLLRASTRLHEFGNRLMVNDANVSFLIKNLPLDDEIRGRVRDYVAVAIECLQDKQVSIMQSAVIQSAVNKLTEISRNAVEALASSRELRQQMIYKVCSDISTSFEQLDLSIEQEEYLTNIVTKTLSKSENADESIDILIKRIDEVTSSLDSAILAVDEKHETATDDDDDAGVLLF